MNIEKYLENFKKILLDSLENAKFVVNPNLKVELINLLKTSMN